MATQNSNTQQDATQSSRGAKVLSGFIYILTCLFILGFFWQSIVSFMFIK